jgi:hypothetical protein
LRLSVDAIRNLEKLLQDKIGDIDKDKNID